MIIERVDNMCVYIYSITVILGDRITACRLIKSALLCCGLRIQFKVTSSLVLAPIADLLRSDQCYIYIAILSPMTSSGLPRWIDTFHSGGGKMCVPSRPKAFRLTSEGRRRRKAATTPTKQDNDNHDCANKYERY